MNTLVDHPEPAARPRQPVAAPDLLAPAGDRDCLVAAVENGADAVYFGLQGHNARARAVNFDLDALEATLALLHRRGVRGYVTLNTLVFPAELEGIEATVRRVAQAGADAVIVQDLGLVRLIREAAPGLEIHASTQMSITSEAGLRLARDLGCSRAILARELSIREVGTLAAADILPVEVFVHGALCVAYSGQCLTSEALGGRSANRGECAQACRMPYELVCDGELVEMGATKYLVSPQDLAAYDLVPTLIEMGVACLKIEGRLKSPEYVAGVTAHYRKAIDEAMAGRPAEFSEAERRDLEMTFSRGLSHGFFDGTDHKALVRGDHAKKRGIYLGRVLGVVGNRVRIELSAPTKPGDGVVFDGDEDNGVPEQGGRVYEADRPATIGRGQALLGFGRNDIDLRSLRPGQRVWKTDDPELTKRLRRSFEGPPRRRVPLDLTVTARVDEALSIVGRTGTGHEAIATADGRLAAAGSRPTTADGLREALDRLGGTAYELRDVIAELEGGPYVPASLLNGLRREVVERLDTMADAPASRAVAAGLALPRVRAELVEAVVKQSGCAALSALFRTQGQVEAAFGTALEAIYLEYQDPKALRAGVEAARAAVPGAEVFVATPRIEKPGEGKLFAYLAKLGADGLLVRNAGGLEFCRSQGIPFVADFAINAANELTVGILRECGARRVTASYDLSLDQVTDLLRASTPGALEIVVHQQIPMFHMEHCVFCAFLSPGTDHTNCGRPCDDHQVTLRDRVGAEHPLKADVGCRNTLYNALPQTAAEFLPRLIERGARHFRVEFLDDRPAQVATTLDLYGQAIAGRRDGRTLWKDLRATSRYGLTRGSLVVLG